MTSPGEEIAAARVPVLGKPRRHWLIAAAGLLALAAIAVWCWPESDPRDRGQGVHAYFPVWQWPAARRSGQLCRFPESAGADAVPFLIAVMRLPDAGSRDWLAGNWGRVPRPLLRFLPQPASAEQIRTRALDQLLLLAQRPDCLPEIVRRFDELPLGASGALVRHMESLTTQTNETLPLLRRAVHGTNAELQELAAWTVLCLGEAGLPLLPDGRRRVQGKTHRTVNQGRDSPGMKTAPGIPTLSHPWGGSYPRGDHPDRERVEEGKSHTLSRSRPFAKLASPPLCVSLALTRPRC